MKTNARNRSVQRRRRPDQLDIFDSPQPQPQPHPIVQLQSVIGNLAVQRMMDVATAQQRIPVLGVNKLGNLLGMKKSKQKGHLNLNRDALMGFLGRLNEELNSRISATREALQAQMADVMGAFDGLVSSADSYLAQSSPKTPGYTAVLELKLQANNEKTQALQIFLQRIKNPVRNRVMPTIRSLIQDNGNLRVDEGNFSHTVGGGMNELRVYDDGGQQDFFKPNVDHLDHYGSIKESDEYGQNVLDPVNVSIMEQTGRLVQSPQDVRDAPQDIDPNVDYGEFGNRENFVESYEQHQSRSVNTEMMSIGGIDVDNLRSSNREVAMARLDMLLDSNLISRAQMALREMDDHTVQVGSLAPKAGGGAIIDYNLVDDQSQHPGTNDTIRRDDPVLLSKLSALNMLDFIAGQIDRHQGNYMIQVDNSGNVTGITGIDNDMSFGTRDPQELAEQGGRELPRIGLYFDSDMAQRILNLDPNLVSMALGDLLTQQEIAMTIARLNILQEHLAQAQSDGKLLQPNQWVQALQTDAVNIGNSEYGNKVFRGN